MKAVKKFYSASLLFIGMVAVLLLPFGQAYGLPLVNAKQFNKIVKKYSVQDNDQVQAYTNKIEELNADLKAINGYIKVEKRYKKKFISWSKKLDKAIKTMSKTSVGPINKFGEFKKDWTTIKNDHRKLFSSLDADPVSENPWALWRQAKMDDKFIKRLLVTNVDKKRSKADKNLSKAAWEVNNSIGMFNSNRKEMKVKVKAADAKIDEIKKYHAQVFKGRRWNPAELKTKKGSKQDAIKLIKKASAEIQSKVDKLDAELDTLP